MLEKQISKVHANGLPSLFSSLHSSLPATKNRSERLKRNVMDMPIWTQHHMEKGIICTLYLRENLHVVIPCSCSTTQPLIKVPYCPAYILASSRTLQFKNIPLILAWAKVCHWSLVENRRNKVLLLFTHSINFRVL